MIALPGRLFHAGDKSQVTGGLVGCGKPPDVGERCFERMGDRVVEPRHGHQQLNVGIIIRFCYNHSINRGALSLDCLEQAKIGVDQGPVERLQVNLLEPSEPAAAEDFALRRGDEPSCEHGTNPVAQGGALMDECRAPRGERSVVFNGRCGHPDAGQVVAAQELRKTKASTLSVLMLASAIAFVFIGLETTILATWGVISLTNAQVLLVTSTATWSVGRRCSDAKHLMALGVTSKLPVCSVFPSWLRT